MKNRTIIRSCRHRMAAATLAVALGLAGQVKAQWAVFEAGPSAIQHLLNQLNTYTQSLQDYTAYYEQAQRWYQTYQHYQQQLVRAQGLFMSQGLTMERPLAEVPEDWNVVAKCGPGFDVSSIASALTSTTDDIVARQRDICGRIQVAQNRKFNATVRFMRELTPKLDRHLQEIRRRRDSSNDEGNVNAVAVDAQNFNNWMNAEFQNWDMQVKMYDNYVATLNETQKAISEVALKGDKSKPIGSPVKTIILQGALSN